MTHRDRNTTPPCRAPSTGGSAGIGPSLTPAIVLAACSFAPTLATGAVLRVPEGHATLRAAVGAAVHHDTILTAPGVHDGPAGRPH